VRHAELPLLVLVVSGTGLWIVNMRALATATVGGDYVHLAQAMGLRDTRIMWRYVGRNALLPALTGLGVAFSVAIAGAPALEEVFSYAGGGWAMQQAAIRGNLPVVQAIFLAIAVSVVVVNLLVDALGVMLDPRLRVS
jgi:peptide/nickel transport system permease protein